MVFKVPSSRNRSRVLRFYKHPPNSSSSGARPAGAGLSRRARGQAARPASATGHRSRQGTGQGPAHPGLLRGSATGPLQLPEPARPARSHRCPGAAAAPVPCAGLPPPPNPPVPVPVPVPVPAHLGAELVEVVHVSAHRLRHRVAGEVEQPHGGDSGSDGSARPGPGPALPPQPEHWRPHFPHRPGPDRDGGTEGARTPRGHRGDRPAHGEPRGGPLALAA